MRKRRISTVQAILAGTCIGSGASGSIVQSEFSAVRHAGRVRNPHRRRLLEVVHSAIALDTSLKAFILHPRCQGLGKGPLKAMGGHLHALQKHAIPGLGAISLTQRSHFQANIVAKRNTFLHDAGTFPLGDAEVGTLLSDMHACLTVVTAL